ncbi:MAG: hypothetical protein GF317_04750 [Candidatus Lokiarchaeota archaeon]|nr:hypothetical protein [Candidatus Lokiarchaeota archaeon]
MKYDKVFVFSHPRSGTFYIRELLILNFFPNKSGRWNTHSWIGDELRKRIPLTFEEGRSKDTAYIYIKRNFMDVAKSIYNIKELFLLEVDSFDSFLKIKYSDMFKQRRLPVYNLYKYGNLLENPSTGNIFFENCNYKPFEFWNKHIKFWEEQVDDVCIVDYDALINNFYDEMFKVALFLDSNKKSFINIKKQVGWHFDNKKVY